MIIIIRLAWVTQWGSQQNMNTVTTVNTSFVTWKSKCKHVCSDLSPVIWLWCFLERLYSCLGWAAGLMRMKMEWTEENGCLLHSCILTMHPLRFPTSFLDFQKPAATWHLVSSTSLFDSWNLESVWYWYLQVPKWFYQAGRVFILTLLFARLVFSDLPFPWGPTERNLHIIPLLTMA